MKRFAIGAVLVLSAAALAVGQNADELLPDELGGGAAGVAATVAVLIVREYLRSRKRRGSEEATVQVAEIEAKQDDKDRLWKRVEDLETKVTALSKENAEQQVKIARLESQIHDRDSIIAELEAKVRELTKLSHAAGA